MDKVFRDQVLNLPVDEKIDLVMDAWDGISPSDFPPLSDEQKAELDRRLIEHEKIRVLEYLGNNSRRG